MKHILILAGLLFLTACGQDGKEETFFFSASQSASPPSSQNQGQALSPIPKAAGAPTPIMFVAQVPTNGDEFATRLSTFANHMQAISSTPRGGDLMLRYPDGVLRNLTKEAGFGMEGFQGANAIAVREPTVHWDGNKAIFSMIIGAPPRQYIYDNTSRWQLYEVSGLARGQTATITKVANQPTNYNNMAPLYTADDRILFTSDRPINGAAHLYPHLDEYESTPTLTGIYQLDPVNGKMNILNHTPSGAFTPIIDSYGRVIFTRWDHLQRDQQAEGTGFGAHNYPDESAGATAIAQQPETFPESRTGMSSSYGPVAGLTYNLFTPWQMNQDGSDELTLNHIGRQEMQAVFLPRSFTADNALTDTANTTYVANKKNIRIDGGIFQIREDPLNPGNYYGIYAREFAQAATNQIVKITGAPTLNAEQMVISDESQVEAGGSLSGGRYRNPLPTTYGQMVASYTSSPTFQAGVQLRLYNINKAASGLYVPGAALTSGITRTVSWWTPDQQRTFSGTLWEVEPVEVVARARPALTIAATKPLEKTVFEEEYVNEAQFRDWLKSKNLALIVTRDQTSRDRNDTQQPFNLRVPGGVERRNGTGRMYDIAHYQILQADMVRAYTQEAGRRPIARPATVSFNLPNTSGPAGSVKIAADGSTAAFVPASRALVWQTTDPNGEAIVRERVWVSFQPGEIRTCGGCHGQNSRNQQGTLGDPANKPEALRALLRHWKATQAPSGPIRVNGSQPLIPGRG